MSSDDFRQGLPFAEMSPSVVLWGRMESGVSRCFGSFFYGPHRRCGLFLPFSLFLSLSRAVSFACSRLVLYDQEDRVRLRPVQLPAADPSVTLQNNTLYSDRKSEPLAPRRCRHAGCGVGWEAGVRDGPALPAAIVSPASPHRPPTRSGNGAAAALSTALRSTIAARARDKQPLITR